MSEDSMADWVKYAFAFVGVLFVLVILSVAFSRLDLNPCWKTVSKGLDNMKTHQGADYSVILDYECVNSMTFTSRPSSCNLACNEYTSDDDQVRACSKVCNSESAESFIVAMPKEDRNLVQRAGDAIGKGNFFWLFTGKPFSYALDCQLVDVSIDSDRCRKVTEGEWRCEPTKDDYREKKKVYEIKIEKSAEGKTCTISRV